MLRKIWDFFVGCFRQVDLVLLALCTGTTLFGCLMIASATHYTGSYKNVVVQLAALCLGIVAYVLMSMLDLAHCPDAASHLIPVLRPPSAPHSPSDRPCFSPSLPAISLL